MIIHPNGTVLNKINANTVLEKSNQISDPSSEFLDQVLTSFDDKNKNDQLKVHPIDEVYLEFLNRPF